MIKLYSKYKTRKSLGERKAVVMLNPFWTTPFPTQRQLPTCQSVSLKLTVKLGRREELSGRALEVYEVECMKPRVQYPALLKEKKIF